MMRIPTWIVFGTILLLNSNWIAPRHYAMAADSQLPNVLLIMADDLGWSDIGIHQGKTPTPNIDQLAREGIDVQRYYGYPLCSPTRAAILTGKMPIRFGIVHALGEREAGLPVGQATLPRSLRDNGYQTWLVGKWHLGIASPPLQSGFDHFYGFMGPGVDYFEHTNRRGAVDWQRNGETLHEAGYTTSLIAKEAQRLLMQRDPDRPFFLQVAFNAPHFPLSAPEDRLDKFPTLQGREKVYAAVLDVLDTSTGDILHTLKEQGLREKTLVIFVSDNGAAQIGSNAPYAQGKSTVYEGGIRLPCIMRWPGKLPIDGSSQQVMTAQDLFPTILTALGLSKEGAVGLDGKDLWQGLSSGQPIDRGPFVIAGRDFAYFRKEWKLIEKDGGGVFLYDLLNDPQETRNMVSADPEFTWQLQRELADIAKQFPKLENPLPPANRPRTPRAR